MPQSPFIVAAVTVSSVDRISPSYVRVEFSAPELAEFGTVGPVFDQRIKLVFPAASGALPDIVGSESWWDAWRSLPETERGAMRTYSVRDLVGDGDERRLVVDLVLHLVPGSTGPASSWASTAAVGDRIIVIGPRRTQSGGGIEFAPGAAEHIVLAGDETAVPAIARILADLPDDAQGAAFLEVPHHDDIDELPCPAGVTVTWLPRAAEPVGTRLVPGVVEHLGGHAEVRRLEPANDDEVWETPAYSASGEADAAADGIPGLYAWIAGESGVVTALRRHLVRDLGVDRSQVAFMGYWREGVAMRA